ncbi:chemotaxis protein CheA [Vibrio sp. 99-70-13A1]|uniref:chemotaxis protein CheA n=1 Tax=Vibrio sp. 99-70-13A1 TaxID=2607601 RepID=UPI0014934E93|nr:chemotaxis protein CheA [Vibrio sp. 99-70-13A1]NOH95210.1 chemotaxis protein CheA [Vibrio sp. 99-70-13A1]
MTNELQAALSTFVNEARELLVDLEQLLLEIDGLGQEPKSDKINSMFRSIHTIKGSAGLFGLDEIVEISHRYETILEQVRDQNRTLTQALIDLGLKVCDVLTELINFIGKPIEGDIQHRYLSLYAELDKHCPQVAVDTKKTLEDASQKKRLSELEGASEFAQTWHVSFRPHPKVFQDGLDPKAFVRYLSQLGTIKSIVVVDDGLFPCSVHGDAENSLSSLDRFQPEELDPEICYLGFEIQLSTSASKQDIEDVFEFIRQDADIHIIPPNSRINAFIELMNQLPESNQRLGEILVQCGAITPHDLLQGQGQAEQENSQESVIHNELGVAKDSHSPYSNTGDLNHQAMPVAVAQAAISKQHQRIHSNKTLRVEADKLDKLIDQVGEIVITGARTTLLAHETGNEALIETIVQLERLVENIRDSSLQLRMVQVGDTFNKFKRIVRDIALSVGKQVTLQINGAETELDKTFVEKLSDPLTHIIRNAIDHGIEPPEQRIIMGKPEVGTISLNAYHESGSIVIEVLDDGRGLDKERVIAQAIEQELITSANHLNERDIFALIFEPGFSTSEQVTNLSGRGVGMDVVKRNIEQLRGNVEVSTEPNVGTQVTIHLPLTLSIIDGFLFEIAGTSYVIPLDNVVECLELHEIAPFETLEGRSFIDLRGEVLPFLRLREWFGAEEAINDSQESLVIVQFGTLRAGLVVDSLLGEFQTVIKPLGRLFEGLKGVSGATILGNGIVAIILDVFSLIQSAVNRQELDCIEKNMDSDEQGA